MNKHKDQVIPHHKARHTTSYKITRIINLTLPRLNKWGSLVHKHFKIRR